MKFRQLARFVARTSFNPLSGFALHSPPTLTSAGNCLAGQTPLTLSITHAVVERGAKAAFNRRTLSVYRQLPQQPGLVGYSVRRELFGDQVWTLTAWESDIDRDRFFSSPVHRDAMKALGRSLLHLRSLRLRTTRAQWPLTWPVALQMLGPSPWIARPAESVRRRDDPGG